MPDSRKTFPVVAGSLCAILAWLILWQVSFQVPLQPSRTEQTILYWVLSTVVSLAFLVFAFMLTRNLAKLYVERRANQQGSKFRTKLVAGALALSLLPVTFLFYFSYVLINRTLTRWFTQPFQNMTQEIREVVVQIHQYALRKTDSDAATIVQGELAAAVRASDLPGLKRLLEAEARRQGVEFAAVESNSGPLARFPADGEYLPDQLSLSTRRSRRLVAQLVHSGSVDYAVAVAPIDPARSPHPSGWLVVGNRLPQQLTQALADINREEAAYWKYADDHVFYRRTYNAILALLTIGILFMGTWVALFLSKQVTVPIGALAEATDQVSKGNLGHRIAVRAADELGSLVRSFNDMVAQLESSRAELERRRLETEALVESIPTPVISLARDGRVLRVNSAVGRVFGAEVARRTTLRELLGALMSPDDLREVDHLMRRAVRQGVATSQFDVTSAAGPLNVAVTVSSLGGQQRVGYGGYDLAFILVIEDLSDLLRAQQAHAWREVAQRVAHEIKNPLTPISLSAERIRRKVAGLAAAQEPMEAQKAIADCAALIEQEVGALKTLVDEFSQLARFPKAQMAPAPLNPVIENALSLFNGRLDGIAVTLDLSPNLPDVSVDAEQFKRVIVNLVDNAAEALEDSLFKEVRVSTSLLAAGSDPRGQFVEVVVADTGRGVSPEIKEKLFLPHFSTKRRGTGLGLAIVTRIVQEHRGTIRVEENQPVGTRFIIELPVVSG